MLAIDEKIVRGDTSAEGDFAKPATLQHIHHFASWLDTHCTNVHIDVPDFPTATG
jgi:hypothetical protein